MAPRRGQSLERGDEYDEFMRKVYEYHQKRGTHFEPEPKVGVRHIDLFKLYQRVVEEGGYDLVSDTKAKPLMWRRLAEEFVGKNQYTAAQAFQIKNVYYKNLCAYEIATHWGKEPPPKEILEEVTAKGANVMTRTLENFARPTPRAADWLSNGDIGDETPEEKTPKDEKTEGADDLGSATGRTSRGLRQQPPQRILFQPDLTPGRNVKGVGQSLQGSPAPNSTMHIMPNVSALSNGASASLASYEPAQSYPLSLKPVITPANNPEFYRNERKRKADANAGPLAKKYRNIMLPGTGFIGPNIYVRAQLALQSGLPSEEEYALHHLVKISHERGDKYRFDQFPGLAEALVKKVLQVGSLFYDVDWDIRYDDCFERIDDDILNALSGTSDVIQKLLSRMPLVTNDSVEDAHFISQISRITEAGLVIRNMSLQGENAHYLSKQPLMRDYLAIVLNLPRHPSIIELQYYALETAEQLIVWCDLGPQDALYQSLLAQLHCEDRGVIIATLKTVARIAMNLAPPKRLDDVRPEVLRKVQNWLVVDDEELRSACLDFLFQYTTFANNVGNLLRSIDAEALARQLGRLLLFGAKENRELRPLPKPQVDNTTFPVPRLSRSVVEGLLKLDEPERSSEWLRMCFLPDASTEMTQISLWQAYQATFAHFHTTHPHLIAGDFIKNVSSTFSGATAQVAGANKYVIKGIRARKVPVESGIVPGARASDRGKELHACHWKMTVSTELGRDHATGVRPGPLTREVQCAEWFKHGGEMFRHILRDHLQLPETSSTTPVNDDNMDIDHKPSHPSTTMANGHTYDSQPSPSLAQPFDFLAADKATYKCRWATCSRVSSDFDGGISRTALFARHVQTHLPDPNSALTVKHNITPDNRRKESTASERVLLATLTDEKGEAAGVPLGAALVLRNIAKFMPKDPPANAGQPMNGQKGTGGFMGKVGEESDDDGEGLMGRIFDAEVRERLLFAIANSRTIHHNAGSVLRAVRLSGG